MKSRLVMCLLLLILAMASVSVAQAETRIGRVEITSEEMLLLKGKSKKATGYFQYFGVDGEEVSGYVTLKVMGTQARLYPKKNYNIHFYTDENCQKSRKVQIQREWGSHSKYCLKANWMDLTQARNIVSARLIAKAQEKYQLFPDSPNAGQVDGFPVEVYVNGEYHGLYTFNIPKAAWLFGLNKKNENHIAITARSSMQDTSTCFTCEAPVVNGEEWEIEVGPDETPEEVAEVFEKLNRLIRFVKDSSDEEFVAQLSQYLDMDACLNYYCFLYRSNAIDNKTKNMILVTFDGKVWYPNLYDVDATWGLYYNGKGLYPPNDAFPHSVGKSLLWDRFAQLFGPEIKARYNELCSTVWSQESIEAAFVTFVHSIPEDAYARDLEKWPKRAELFGSLSQIIEYAALRGGYAASCIDEMAFPAQETLPNRMVYQLTVPYEGSQYAYRNTGVNLYQEEMPEFTIILQYSSNPESVAAKKGETLLSNNNQDRHGLIVETSNAGYTVFYAGQHQYEALYDLAQEVHSLVIVKQRNRYSFYVDGVENVRTIEDPEGNILCDTNLYLGAQNRMTSTGKVACDNNFTGTVWRFEVWDYAMSIGKVTTLMEEMCGTGN